MNNKIVIEPKSGKAVRVKRGQVLRVEDLDGGQVADFVCFSLNDYVEKFSQAKTGCAIGPPASRLALNSYHDACGKWWFILIMRKGNS